MSTSGASDRHQPQLGCKEGDLQLLLLTLCVSSAGQGQFSDIAVAGSGVTEGLLGQRS